MSGATKPLPDLGPERRHRAVVNEYPLQSFGIAPAKGFFLYKAVWVCIGRFEGGQFRPAGAQGQEEKDD